MSTLIIEEIETKIEALAHECAEAAFNEGASGPFDDILWGDAHLLADELPRAALSEEEWREATSLFLRLFNEALAGMTLQPKELADGWVLADSSNQLWWPADCVQAAILASEDPEEAILQAYHDGADGEWAN